MAAAKRVSAVGILELLMLLRPALAVGGTGGEPAYADGLGSLKGPTPLGWYETAEDVVGDGKK